ncbi:translation initiation factor IF-2 N-terminal domain-containing protein, partial [Pimelobacter simplex]
MAKTRVSELAKKYGIKSADALKMLNDIGEFAKTASSSIELPAVKKFEDTYGTELLSKMKPGAEASAKPAAPKPAPAKKAAAAPAPEAPAAEAPVEAPAAPAAPAPAEAAPAAKPATPAPGPRPGPRP